MVVGMAPSKTKKTPSAANSAAAADESTLANASIPTVKRPSGYTKPPRIFEVAGLIESSSRAA